MNTVYTATDGMVAEQQTITNLSSNLANLESPGFLRLVTTTVGDPVGSLTRNGGPGGSAVLSPPIDQGTAATTAISTAEAPITMTQVPTDLAITGPGFLTVRTPAGVAYTRDGACHISPSGMLVTTTGDPVLTVAHQPVHLDPAAPFTVSSTGVITQVGRAPQPLALVNLRGTLTDLGQSVYQGTPAAFTGAVIQGALSQSNVSLSMTMTDLIQAQSSYAANADVFNEESSRLSEVATLAQITPAP